MTGTTTHLFPHDLNSVTIPGRVARTDNPTHAACVETSPWRRVAGDRIDGVLS
ncbi:hypothetical protein ACWDUL_20940 [Nocardia niigatensis]